MAQKKFPNMEPKLQKNVKNFANGNLKDSTRKNQKIEEIKKKFKQKIENFFKNTKLIKKFKIWREK